MFRFDALTACFLHVTLDTRHGVVVDILMKKTGMDEQRPPAQPEGLFSEPIL